MMNANLNTIREEGFRVLVDGLGTTGTVTFLRQFDNGSGNYTEEREKLFEGVTIDEIADRIQRRKAQGSKP